MTHSKTITALGALLAVSILASSNKAEAASASVSVAIHFDVAPVDLIRAGNIAPASVRTCQSLKVKVDAGWENTTRAPKISCRTQKTMPLIVTDENSGALVVRP